MSGGRRILLAGESWSTTSVHTKGFDTFHTSTYEEGAWPFIHALEAGGWSVEFQPNHVAAEKFPYTVEELSVYDLVVLSDIGANTLLLTNAVFTGGRAAPANRLASLAAWVAGGGSLLMVGGYLSFQGIEGKANYRSTALAEVLPVVMEIGDDREETPEAIVPHADGGHEITRGLEGDWPGILGFQRMTPAPGAEVVATVGSHPLVVVGQHGAGRVAAVTTDMGPHWLTSPFVEWPGYARLWNQLAQWLTRAGATETER
ncbi:glutamine amidotransferase [Microbacterium trichothecenolyticum]|uniref:Membrane protein n=1 Tax=Microbacterium trichothecenolyticum TaxID=69370 RepID=A0ABU0TWQ1_MICTR|nr:glutamine amidotransferase [Microbacterium trichothecenolyticum]MDQ1124064.1 putative membrane protein [Microbacterium trichothecenolyticum]